MRTLSANKARTRFGELLDIAQREPVRVTRRDKMMSVMVSAQDFEAMRAFYANRLLQTMDEAGAAAEHAGLNPKRLTDLLVDES